MAVRKLLPDEELVDLPSNVRALQPGELEGDIPPSRTGLVPENIRQDVRAAMEAAPAPVQLGAEMSPALTGTAFGGLAGSFFGPAGLLLGGMAGGALGEFLGQETGITPQSDVGLAAAAGGPLLGRVLGPAAQLLKRGAAKAATVPAPVSAALARVVSTDAVDAIGAFGARVLAKQTGLMNQPASQLYKAAREVGARLNPRNSRVPATLDKLEDELMQFSSFSEIREVMRLLQNTRAIFEKDFIGFSEVITLNKLIGVAVRKAEKTLVDTGAKLGSSKLVFKALKDDIDELAKFGIGAKGKGARLVQVATKRAKLEFSIDELNQVASKHTKYLPEQDEAILDINGLRNSMRKMLDPNSKQFNKNFADALGGETQPLMNELAVLAKMSKSLNPSGPGGLVVRGLGAAAGGAAGFAVGGAAGAAVGTLGGVGLPEMLMGIMLSPAGRKALRKAAVAGRGELNAQEWQLIGQAVVQSIKPSEGDTSARQLLDDFIGGG